MIDHHLQKLRRRDEISAEEERAIRDAPSEILKVRAGGTVIKAGEELEVSTLVLEGWLARVKDLKSGQRQVTELHLPGDFADLHSFTLKRLDHDIVALTPLKIALVPHDRLKRITERFPHLTRVYWFSTNLDAAIHREWVLSMGRRSASSAMAHIFCELQIRLEIIGQTRGYCYDFPLTQDQLSECLGLTAVHVNRTLQELRARGLITLERKVVTILDWEGLQALAEFDPAYLYLERKAR